MKKFLTILLSLCLCASVSFAEFDPYADEEPEGKPTKKLIYGLILTVIGGVLTYDGFSQVEEDVSRPSVDYTTVLHSEWNRYVTTTPYGFEKEYFETGNPTIGIKSGISEWEYKLDGDDTVYKVGTDAEKNWNILYNNGNVDLKNITIEVRYKKNDGSVIPQDYKPDSEEYYRTANGIQTSEDYHIATVANTDGTIRKEYKNKELKKGESLSWQDIWGYCSSDATPPAGNGRSWYDPKDKETYPYDPVDGEEDRLSDLTGLNLGENALELMDVRVKLEKNINYKPIIRKRNKSDIEGVCGILMCAAGIYFIIDYFVDMHKFNVYAKKHQLNMRIATAPNEYKLLLQKRI